MQNGVAVVHQLADLRHRRARQRLHDGRELGVKRPVIRHPLRSGCLQVRGQLCAYQMNSDYSEYFCRWP